MVKKELISRWRTEAGQKLLKEILSTMRKNKNLNHVLNLEMIDNRWDLRGAVLSIVESEKTIGNQDHLLNQKFGTLKLKHAELENIDFSYAEINYATFQECSFNNCLFTETRAEELRIYATDFNNCEFLKTNFSYSFMNMNIASHSGSYMNCKFTKTNLKECVFSFPIVDNCFFQDCNLYATNFDGSRLRHVKFKGKVDSPWFKGFSISADKSLFLIFNRINPRDYPNEMVNVDFTEAELRGVSFSDSIDLTQCHFPENEMYIYIENLNQLMSKVRLAIEQNWTGENKRKGLALLDDVYFTKHKTNQNQDFIDMFPIPTSDADFDELFFGLIKTMNRDVISL